jgi:hypothetical protein
MQSSTASPLCFLACITGMVEIPIRRDCCVYFHIVTIGNQPVVFYVGQGLSDRPHFSRRNRFWHNFVNKHGPYEVIIDQDGLTHEEACELERKWIAWFGRRDLKQGTLVNLTDGGDGPFGYKRIHSAETKRKISLGLMGKQPSDQARAKMSASRRGKKLSLKHIEACKAGFAKSWASGKRKKPTISDDEKAKRSARMRAVNESGRNGHHNTRRNLRLS